MSSYFPLSCNTSEHRSLSGSHRSGQRRVQVNNKKKYSFKNEIIGDLMEKNDVKK